jgi:NADH-quinone oxidoreductase subunit F
MLKMEKIFLKTDFGKTIDNYEFLGLNKALRMKPSEVLEKVKENCIRGRGGAGFPAGIKWDFVAAEKSEIKFVVCNGDEGEPGTFKDRFLLENLPFKVIEGIIIAGYAVDARYGYIYIRGEYEKAIKSIRESIHKMTERKLLGKSILGSSFGFELKLIRGAGAYVCGDETSLLNSIEGKRGLSRIKPPLPAKEGLYEKPTLVNNVETLSVIAEILKYDQNIYLSLGTPKSRGTKLLSISGDVKNPGVYEIEFGKMSIMQIINDLAGGVKGSGLGFVMPGGIATNIISDEQLDTPYTYEDLEQTGSSLGSGGMIVVSKDRDYLSIVKNISDFFMNETCGTCFPCREGNRNINKMIDKMISDGKVGSQDIEIIREIKQAIGLAARCGFGQASVNSILSILEKYFEKKVYV